MHFVATWSQNTFEPKEQKLNVARQKLRPARGKATKCKHTRVCTLSLFPSVSFPLFLSLSLFRTVRVCLTQMQLQDFEHICAYIRAFACLCGSLPALIQNFIRPSGSRQHRKKERQLERGRELKLCLLINWNISNCHVNAWAQFSFVLITPTVSFDCAFCARQVFWQEEGQQLEQATAPHEKFWAAACREVAPFRGVLATVSCHSQNHLGN